MPDGTQYVALLVAAYWAVQLVRYLRRPRDWPRRDPMIVAAVVGIVASVATFLFMATLVV